MGAIRHDLLVAYFHIVRDHVPYRDLGPDWQRSAARSSTAPDACTGSSKRSATPSRSSQSSNQAPNKPLNQSSENPPMIPPLGTPHIGRFGRFARRPVMSVEVV